MQGGTPDSRPITRELEVEIIAFEAKRDVN